ncbi:RusA family crossover junction endodeoxyribonuclease [Jiella endophytica]|uniref:RusA family crossover junction endodeoxyribonuclease n=1 Tax=Jiella endophytica TaxID=2558362 RepID=A0A4Y8RDU9_9HYPH|nr:RusA family crossover junction endodeoxyribonuclease [Jiella endophytica]TFF20472.1 RusA family crossover junction endodeoxyribonuclease [Jiella endophytica]
MYPELPFESLIPGIPVSHQAKGRGSLQRWKAHVTTKMREDLPEGNFAFERPLAVRLYFFPQARLEADIDNCAKPILDAMGGCVYLDDRQVECLLVQKFEPGRPLPVDDVTGCLKTPMEAEEPVIYVRVDAAPGDER